MTTFLKICVECGRPARGPRSLRCEECQTAEVRAATAKYKAKNRDRVKAYTKARYWRNRTRLLAECRAYYAKRNPPMGVCSRMHLKATTLPCGKHEACSGCEKIGGRRVDMAASGFRFGHGM